MTLHPDKLIGCMSFNTTSPVTDQLSNCTNHPANLTQVNEVIHCWLAKETVAYHCILSTANHACTEEVLE